jgi:hypothetical protein
MKKRNQHQVKAGWYYIFWSIMALSVVAGQLYVGTGYRDMSESLDKTKEALIYLEMERLSESLRMR